MRSWIVVACLAGSSLGSVSAAQTTAREPEEGRLDEIVVTAQRRSENLQDVPLAVQAFTADRLESAGIASTVDLATVVPGLVYSKGIGLASPYLRGVGTTSNGPGIENPIALYLDGVYIASKGAAFMSLSNIERIEVLRGPQGTLFGRNATGGLIHIITRDPSHEPTMKVSVGYGNYQTVTSNLYAATGLGDKLAADLTVYYSKQNEGYGRNIFTGSDINDTYEMTMRSKWLFTPSDATRITLSADYGEYDTTAGAAYRPIYGAKPRYGSLFTAGPFDVDDNFDPYFRSKAGGVSGKIEHELGFADFISTSSYRKIRYQLHLDSDIVRDNVLGVVGDVKEKNFSQEFQLTGGEGQALKWTAGAYLYLAKGQQLGDVSGSLLGATLLSRTFGEQKTESLAGYVQATQELGTATRATVGLRYTSEWRKLEGYRRITNAAGDTLLPATPQKADFQKLTWRLALDHDFSDDVMGYVSYNRGFRSGGFNAGTIPSAAVDPEVLDAYEAGLKTELLDRKLRLNFSGFYYDFKDIQLSSFVNTVQALRNAARARLYGVDVDFEAVITPEFRLSGGAEYLKATFRSFPGGPIATSLPAGGNLIGVAPDLKGNDLARTPRWTANIAADYTVPVGEGEIDLNVTYSYNDGYFHEPDNRLREDAYSLVNAAITWSAPDDRYRIGIWGRNLTDTRYSLNASKQSVGDSITLAAPRTYGVTLGMKF